MRDGSLLFRDERRKKRSRHRKRKPWLLWKQAEQTAAAMMVRLELFLYEAESVITYQ